MRAGKLRHKVSIEAPITVTADDGGTREKWQPVVTDVFASIEALKGREWFDAGGTQSEVDHRIRTRFRKGITSDMRVVYKDRQFDIQHPADVRGERRELHLMCKEYVGTDNG